MRLYHTMKKLWRYVKPLRYSFISRFCKVPPQLCDDSSVIHDICSSSSSRYNTGTWQTDKRTDRIESISRYIFLITIYLTWRDDDVDLCCLVTTHLSRRTHCVARLWRGLIDANYAKCRLWTNWHTNSTGRSRRRVAMRLSDVFIWVQVPRKRSLHKHRVVAQL